MSPRIVCHVSRLSRSVVLACVALATLFAPESASAHSGKQSYLYVSLFDDGVEGAVEIPLKDLGPALGIDFQDPPGGVVEAVQASSDEITDYITRHTALRDASGEWPLVYGDVSVLGTENGPYAAVDFVVDKEFTTTPRSFVAEFSVIIENDPEKDALFHISDDWRSGVFANGDIAMLGFSVGQTEQVIELADTSTLTSMGEIRGLGSDAVRVSIDVLLIVAGIAAITILVPRRPDDRPPVGGTEVARRTVRTAALFTLAATVTTALTGPGPLTPSPWSARLVVAMTLGAVAVYLVTARLRSSARSLFPAMSVVAGVGFGIGLGAEFVAKGLDRTRPLTSFVAFQFGALVAALLVAVFVAVPLLLLRRTRVATVIAVVLSVMLAGYAVAWIGELVADSDWPIEEVANPLRVWPRNFWFVVLAIAAAAAVRSIENRSGRLRSPADGVTGLSESRLDEDSIRS